MPDTPHLLAVDGNSLVHRAFHAGKDDPEAVGPWVTAIVVRMLAQVWPQGPFDGVLFGFDHAVNTRKQRFPEYKAGRSDKDPELVAQLASAPEHLEACGFTVVSPEGLEADDVMAAVAEAVRERGWRASIVSSDRDLLPLVCDLVTLLQPRGGMADTVACTPARVHADHGVPPSQYLEYAALRGDPSDGLPGVDGIGPKTAARLLRDYGDVATLYRQLPYLSTKVERGLRAGRERLYRNLEIMRPIPTAVDLDAVLRDGVDCDLLDLELGSLGLEAVAGRFRGAVERPALPPMPPPPEDDGGRGWQEPLEVLSLAPVAADEQVSLF